MSDGQWRALVLIILLAALEIIGNPGAQGILTPLTGILQRGATHA